MGCGGFTCSKNALAALNVLYILVAFILIGVAAYGKAVAIITSLSLMSGIIACGVFLLLVAMVGLVGAIKHHQVMLFFYMVILFLLFLVQFAIACACLAVNDDQQKNLAVSGWQKAGVSGKKTVQTFFECCGFDEKTQDIAEQDPSLMGHPVCPVSLSCCGGDDPPACCNPVYNPVNGTNSSGEVTPPTTQKPSSTDECTCSHCWEIMHEHMNQALKIAGGIGLFFSFTEVLGIYLAFTHRNNKDPRANPSAFL